ncbi:MAG TPA: hypothetical protein VFR90_03865 [Methylibium sp.]|uniref:hypothetical protein n=1 Tax=Methylibium sp. TaxID=2067992 RepID=UPI002DB8B187|nr:hypothetical protein [Methylibium sp.]HEU4458235.1 hypothetical protein [Methylibium sp.]
MTEARLYGASSLDLEEGCALLQAAVAARFEAHESLYRGGKYYRLRTRDDVELVLQLNFIEDDGEATESDFPQATLLLYVHGNNNAVASTASCIESARGGFELLLRTSG